MPVSLTATLVQRERAQKVKTSEPRCQSRYRGHDEHRAAPDSLRRSSPRRSRRANLGIQSPNRGCVQGTTPGQGLHPAENVHDSLELPDRISRIALRTVLDLPTLLFSRLRITSRAPAKFAQISRAKLRPADRGSESVPSSLGRLSPLSSIRPLNAGSPCRFSSFSGSSVPSGVP